MPTVDISSLFQPSPASAVPVIDPPLKEFGRVWVSLQHVVPTAGLARYQSGHPYPPSMCLLFQQQRCQAGVHCNQIHADREFVATVRLLLKSRPYVNCCASHGDLPSRRQDFTSFCQKARIVLKLGDGTTVLDGGNIAATAFWEKVMANPSAASEVLITPGEICYLHQQANCKYGVDCKHVHICRAKFAEVAARLGNLPASSVFTTTTTTSAPSATATTTKMAKASPRRTQPSPRAVPAATSNATAVAPLFPMAVPVPGPIAVLPMPPSLLLAMGAMLSAAPAGAAAPAAPVISVSPSPVPVRAEQATHSAGVSPSARLAVPQSRFGARSFTDIPLSSARRSSVTTTPTDTAVFRARRNSAPLPALMPLVSSLQAVLDEALLPSMAASEEGCSPTSSDSTAQRLLSLMESPTTTEPECPARSLQLRQHEPVIALKSVSSVGSFKSDEEDGEVTLAAAPRIPIMPLRAKSGAHGVSSRGFVGAVGSPTDGRRGNTSSALRGIVPVPQALQQKVAQRPRDGTQAWAEKAASSRGRFRGVVGAVGSLPSQQTRGPASGAGFQAGRGKPL